MKSRLLCACACLVLATGGLTAARAESPEFQTISQLRETCPKRLARDGVRLRPGDFH